jgi:hypothetical protein
MKLRGYCRSFNEIHSVYFLNAADESHFGEKISGAREARNRRGAGVDRDGTDRLLSAASRIGSP